MIRFLVNLVLARRDLRQFAEGVRYRAAKLHFAADLFTEDPATEQLLRNLAADDDPAKALAVWRAMRGER